jgi:hypothetical protein
MPSASINGKEKSPTAHDDGESSVEEDEYSEDGDGDVEKAVKVFVPSLQAFEQFTDPLNDCSAEIFMRKKPGSGKEKREGLRLIEWKEGEPCVYVIHSSLSRQISE